MSKMVRKSTIFRGFYCNKIQHDMVENGEKTQTHDIKFEFLRNQRLGVRLPLGAPKTIKVEPLIRQ